MSLRISPQVRQALTAGRAVVALESTVITHGLPRPRNLELARQLEDAVESHGAVPATIALLNGEIAVGLEPADLERLAAEESVDKASLWNLAALSASGTTAGTTVAATLHIADAAGIRVFATGGIGGVHRRPFDESADLTALARYAVLTVCAGPKSILDAEATLERLETLGIPAVGYRSRFLAGFHVPQTRLPLPASFDTPEQIAAAFERHRTLGLAGGLLVSNPVSSGIGPDELAALIDEAEGEAEAAGIGGKDTTPFMLSRLAERSQGRTVDINLRLLRENAVLAARIAVAMRRPQEQGAGHG